MQSERTVPCGIWLSGLVALLIACASGCDGSRREYPASSPDTMLDSARDMIANGEADRLSDLVYAEDEQMRSFLNQVGGLLGSLHGLGDAIEARFPEEIAAFRAEAERAAAEGRTNPLLSRLVASGRPGGNATFGISQMDRSGLTLDTGSGGEASGGRRGGLLGGGPSDSQREIFNGIIKQLLADPYGWLEDGRDRIDHVYLADDMVSLTWDGRVILPPFGLTLLEEDGRWFLVPPTSYPGVRMVLPRSDDEWYVWGSMIKTLERVVIDLERDVRSGRVRNMTDLADSATEKVAIPAMLIFFAYTNLIEQRQAEADKAEAAAGTGAEPADAAETSAP